MPESVDAFSESTLSNFGVHSLSDLNQIDPSFEVLSSGATQQRLVIRGIASTTTQTVGIYMDDVPLLGGYNGNTFGDGSPPVRLHDLDEAQVLKGPQGTLFGAGSMSGTLVLTTRRPNLNAWGGHVDASVAGVEDGNPEYDGTYVLNAPIIKHVLAVRLVGWTEQGGGYIDKFTAGQLQGHPDSGNRQIHGWRATALWRPTDKLDVQFTALNQDADVDGPDYSTLRVGDIGLGYIPPPPHTDPWVNYDYTADWTDTTYDLYYLRLSYDLGFGNLIATASDGEDSVSQDTDTTAAACAVGLCPPSSPPTAYFNDILYRDYTTEIRFSSNFSGPFQIVAGVFTQQDRKTYYGSALRANPSTGMPTCDGYFDCVSTGQVQESTAISPYADDVIFLNSELLTTHQYAVYAQADYKILPKLTLTLGTRYFSANLNDAANTGYFPTPASFTPFGAPSPEAHQSKPTYNVALLWQATPDWSVYGRVATGFRIGGVNTDSGEAAAAGLTLPTTYNPDWLTDYEVGTKIYLLNHRLYLDASAYHINWTNQQLEGLVAGTFAYQLNAGETKTDGGELAVTALPVK
ncbi:MAG: TonB-dependent receptor, partial [Chloroflexota bacterium]